LFTDLPQETEPVKAALNGKPVAAKVAERPCSRSPSFHLECASLPEKKPLLWRLRVVIWLVLLPLGDWTLDIFITIWRVAGKISTNDCMRQCQVAVSVPASDSDSVSGPGYF